MAIKYNEQGYRYRLEYLDKSSKPKVGPWNLSRYVVTSEAAKLYDRLVRSVVSLVRESTDGTKIQLDTL